MKTLHTRTLCCTKTPKIGILDSRIDVVVVVVVDGNKFGETPIGET